jgi:hypothetical protein
MITPMAEPETEKKKTGKAGADSHGRHHAASLKVSGMCSSGSAGRRTARAHIIAPGADTLPEIAIHRWIRLELFRVAGFGS